MFGKVLFISDIGLIILSALGLVASFFFKLPYADLVLGALSFLGLIPVIASAVKDLFKRKLSVDLLASIALIFSLLAHEWFSAAFITLMLAFARVFDHVTEARAKKTIKSLMKYHVERVHVRIHDTVKEVHIREIKPGDEVIVESGERMPVDGIVVSGEAEVDESSLTGESELVGKRAGDRVFTSTINESGSLVVRTEKVGKDTTLSRIVALVEESSRNKNRAERMADRFTQWYIFLALVASAAMYAYGLSTREVLSVLLVVCADDIAVAVPLAFTAAISHAARRGVVVKGSAALEQLSKMKYVLTDKTGTLTRGKPKIVDVKAYHSFPVPELLKRFVMGASESRHAVSLAIMEYGYAHDVKVHTPDDLEEISGQGISFKHDGSRMLLGRLSFMEREHCRISPELKRDAEAEKDAGRGVVCLSVNGDVVGLVSYEDELRPHARDIIAETKRLGVSEWHMLTGDNERSASAVASSLGVRHYHANMTPESKVEFVRKFERAKEPSVVGYIGDGVNDAASLSLADVSVAMGGIGADAAIEAADMTIMKDHLGRLPEMMGLALKVRRIMWQNFAIWALSNCVGLLWVLVGIPGLGILGPAGAATYNFLTDFLPIGNALRAGRGRR